MERNAETAMEKLKTLFPKSWENGSEYYAQPINPETGNKLSKRLVTWLKDNIGNFYTAERYLVNLCWPNVEYAESRLMVRMWLNEADRKKGQSARRLVKPKKALRYLFPWLSERDADRWVDSMRVDLGERVYTLKTANDAESFVLAYTGPQCRMENPMSTVFRKSLANSCMRYESIMHHDNNGVMRHPVEAYASGDFEIAYTTDSKGHIAARCVIYRPEGGTPVAAPIYGVCEKSMDMVQEYLDSIEALYDGAGDWIGARLDCIEGKHGGYIAPYLDLSPSNLELDGAFLVVDRHGDIDASNYSGLLNGEPESMCTCEHCGARYDSEEEGGFVNDMLVCDSCYQDSNYCEYYDERIFEYVSAVYLWHRGRRSEEYWCDNAIGEYAERVNGDCWRTEDLYTDHNGDYITPEQVEGGEYFLSDWSGEFYPSADMCETSEGAIVSKLELEADHGIWQQDSSGIWSNVQLDLELEGKAA